MLQISKVLKAWLEIVDDPPIVVPAFAQASSVTVNTTDGTLYMEFAAITAELDAVAAGKKYEVRSGYASTTMLELTPVSTTATAKDVRKSAAYEIEEQDPENTSALAFLPPPAGTTEATPLEIVAVGQVKGKNQIAIASGGKCEVSSNLIGKTIKIQMPVSYPEVVLISQKPIELITAHLVVLWKDLTIKYTALSCTTSNEKTINNKTNTKQIYLRFDSSSIHFTDLKISIYT